MMRPTVTFGAGGGRALAVVLAGFLGAASFAPLDLFPSLLVSSSLFLWILRDRDTREARNLGLLYGLALGLSSMHWLASIFGLPFLSLVAVFAVYFGLAGHLVGLTRRFPPGVRAVAAAVFIMGIEWFRGEGPVLPFPWYTPAHALAPSPDWIAAARWTGSYGLSLIIWWIAALGAFSRPAAWLLFALLPLSSFVLPEIPAPDRRALLVQAEGFEAPRHVIERLDTTPVDLAVLPELAYTVSPEISLMLPGGPRVLAAKVSAPVVFGCVEGVYTSDSFQNVAAVIDSSCRILGTFPKQRPVPLFVDGQPGRRLPVFAVGGETLGVAICYDFDVPSIAARLVERGATVLVMPTTDRIRWTEKQHRDHELLARLRSVENGRWLLRAASSGRSEVIDPLGRPSSSGLDFAESGAIILPYGNRTDRTPGSRLWILGPAAAAITLLFILGETARSLRRRP